MCQFAYIYPFDGYVATMAEVKIADSWKAHLADEFKEPYFEKLTEFVRKEYQQTICYPKASEIFSCFDHCSFDQTKVVILGQDPYHGPNQANGLCFSVRKGIPFPPSLCNIFKEIQQDLQKPFPENGDLSRWALQGVLLLNATLTVRASQAGSHQNKGWEQFTDSVIRELSEEKKDLVFLLWGAYAQRKGSFIDRNSHLVLSAAHPSPFSAHKGFFGCRHFSKTNVFLTEKNNSPIDW